VKSKLTSFGPRTLVVTEILSLERLLKAMMSGQTHSSYRFCTKVRDFRARGTNLFRWSFVVQVILGKKAEAV